MSTRAIVGWSIVGVVIILLACVVWIGLRALAARADLEASVRLVSQIKEQIGHGDVVAAAATSKQLTKKACSARDLTSDPVWRSGEIVPWIGGNLVAVRQVSDVVCGIADKAVPPLVNVVGSVDLASFKPVNGVVPLEPLVKIQPTTTKANTVLQIELGKAESIDTSGTIGPVTSAVSKLTTVLKGAGKMTDAASRAVQLLPGMLGQNGPRNYLVIVQNNAELRSTGGIVGALALLHTQNGAITLVQQASASDFPTFEKPVLPLPAATSTLYGNITGEYIQDVTLTPRFPLSAALAGEMWERQFDTKVDGVLSMDPIALSYLLSATGPVSLGTGDQLTSDNAVQTLLRDAYARYDDPTQQNEFFATAAAAVFTKVASGDVDPKVMVTALARAGEEDRVLVWSAHSKEQSSIEQTTLAGGLPNSTQTQQRFGIYLNDATGAKMDYYLHTSVELGRAMCRTDQRPNYSVRVTLKSSAPLDAATTLPSYVTGAGLSGVPAGNISTTLAVYAPPGAVLVGVNREGKNVASQREQDGGHAVAHLLVQLAPGEGATYDFQFVGASDRATGGARPASLQARATPGVSATDLRSVPFTCADVLK